MAFPELPFHLETLKANVPRTSQSVNALQCTTRIARSLNKNCIRISLASLSRSLRLIDNCFLNKTSDVVVTNETQQSSGKYCITLLFLCVRNLETSVLLILSDKVTHYASIQNGLSQLLHVIAIFLLLLLCYL